MFDLVTQFADSLLAIVASIKLRIESRAACSAGSSRRRISLVAALASDSTACAFATTSAAECLPPAQMIVEQRVHLGHALADFLVDWFVDHQRSSNARTSL